MSLKRLKASCSVCPLEGSVKVPSAGPPEGAICEPPFVVVCPPVDDADVATGRPLAGPSGSMIKAALSQAGLREDRLWFVPSVACKCTQASKHEAMLACSTGLRDDLERLGIKHGLSLGREAFESLGFMSSLKASRGNKHTSGKLDFVPSLGTDDVKSWKSGTSRADGFLILVQDAVKAYKYATGMLADVEENFIIGTDLGRMLHVLKGLENKTLGIDIETDSLSRYVGKIVCIGLAWTESDALVVPWHKDHDRLHWTPEEARLLQDELNKVLSRNRLVLQNAAFDVPYLRYHGFKVESRNIEHDTYLLHSNASPEQEHNLGFITTLYGKTPQWKETFKNRPGSIYSMPLEELWKYNARDCCVLLQVLDPLLELAGNNGSFDEYLNVTMPLLDAVFEMEETGIGFEPSRLEDFKRLLEREMAKFQQEIRKKHSLPPEFMLSNSQHLAFLLYGFRPKWASRVEKELLEKESKMKALQDEIDELSSRALGSRMKPSTVQKMILKKTAMLQRKTETAELADLREKQRILAIKTFSPPSKWNPSLTSEASPSTDKEALLSFKICLQNESEELDERMEKHQEALEALAQEGKMESASAAQRKRWLDECEGRIGDVQSMLELLGQIERHSKLFKLKSGFTKYAIAPDGRIHPSWNAGGAATGRFSCSNPNLMQIPTDDIGIEARRFFQPASGNVLISADFENAEVALFGFETEDAIIIEAYEKKLNLHDINARTLFGIDKDSPFWKSARAAAKIMQFGRYQYGGGLGGIHRQLAVKAPGLNLTYAKLKEADERWWKAHPSVKEWAARVEKEVLEKRILRNAFGRVRTFTNNDGAIGREGKNFLIQSACASLINQATLAIRADIKEACYDAKMVMQVHDELVFEASQKDAPAIASIMRERLESPFVYRGKLRNLRVGLAWGLNFGDMVDLEEIPSAFKL